MDVLTPIVTGAILAVFAVILAWLGKERFERIEAGIDQVRTEVLQMRAELLQMRAEMLAMRSEFRQEIAGVRSDLTLVALAVGAQQRPQTG